jgi:hypothetical protein
MLNFSTFCAQCGLIDKKLTSSTLDRLFIAANVEVSDMDDNPDNELCRFELLEIIARCAQEKFITQKNPNVTTCADGITRILEDNVLPHVGKVDWQTFRDRELWCLSVNDVFFANLNSL